MNTAFWLKRLTLVLIGTFVLLGVAQLLKGHAAPDAWLHAAIWAPITTGVYILAVLYHARRGRQCALCADTTQQPPGHGESV